MPEVPLQDADNQELPGLLDSCEGRIFPPWDSLCRMSGGSRESPGARCNLSGHDLLRSLPILSTKPRPHNFRSALLRPRPILVSPPPQPSAIGPLATFLPLPVSFPSDRCRLRVTPHEGPRIKGPGPCDHVGAPHPPATVAPFVDPGLKSFFSTQSYALILTNDVFVVQIKKIKY